jgi:hypothetical protein
MPHRTPRWVWAGRGAALAAVIGLAVYLAEVGLGRAAVLAGPVGLVIALAALLAPYLLPLYQSPPPDPARAAGVPPPSPGKIFYADHGGVVAETIGEVTINPPPPDPDPSSGQAGR